MFARWYVMSLREQKRIEEERRRQEELEQERQLREKEAADSQIIEESLKYVVAVINIAGSVITHLIYQHSFNVTQA
jgi:Mg2+/citrate symporter